MISNRSKTGTIIPLFIPWLLASVAQLDPILSYWIAWGGSFFIFFWSLVFPSRYLSGDIPAWEQIMRPIFLVQMLFAGLMSCTSVFYFLNHLGYVYFERINTFVISEQTFIIAKCQRLNVLGHAAIVSGMILLTKPSSPIKLYRLNNTISHDKFLIILSVVAFVGGFLIQFVPGVFQFTVGLTNTGIICGTFVMIRGILRKKSDLFLMGGGVFLVNLISATLTGFKEPIFVSFLIVGCLLFPFYKRLTIILGIPLIFVLIYILPTYASVVRGESWSGDATAEQARSQAFETILNEENSGTIEQTNWRFLTDRFSEIGMFTQFVATTPSRIDYYGFEILNQTLQALIPRVLWPGKPITETVSMERVYNADVVSRASTVSAKTRPVVDGYLSAGTFGVFIYLFFYGLACQALCNKSESLFGGYHLGCIIFFNGCFQPIWRGNTAEFVTNSIFWSFILMLIIFQILKSYKILLPINNGDNLSNQRIL